MFNRLLRFFRREKPKLIFAGIYGITEDGCYLVMGEDGVIRKTLPVQPPVQVSGSGS